MEVLVKHVLALALLSPFLFLSVPVWINGQFGGIGLYLIFPVLLILLLFVNPLNRPRVLRYRGVANILGPIASLSSIFLPTMLLDNQPVGPSLVQSSHGAPQLIAMGSIITFFTSFGSLVTLIGLEYAQPIWLLCSPLRCPTLTTGPGFWLGWVGAAISLLGRPWTYLPQNQKQRKLASAIIFPLGLITAIFGLTLPSGPYNPLLIVVGTVMCGTGLNFFLEPKPGALSLIRRIIQQPLRRGKNNSTK